MEGGVDYNGISRIILSKYQDRLSSDLLQSIKQGKDIASISSFKQDGHELILLHFEIIPTTMILSEEWPRELVTPKRSFAFSAVAQSQGRGQHSNTWSSPPSNMYLTLLIEKEFTFGRYLPMLIANHTAKTIKSYFKDTSKANKLVNCKWINDIFIGNKKVCGSLVKASNQDDKFYFQIGIGVNVNASPIQGSTSLSAQSGRSINVRDFTVDYARGAVRAVCAINGESAQAARQQYRKQLLYLMQRVNIFKTDLSAITHSGIFQDVTEDGMAVLLLENGEREIVGSGKMRPTFTE